MRNGLAFTDRCNEYRATLLAFMMDNVGNKRVADGPDEAHKMTIARRELRRHDPDFRM